MVAILIIAVSLAASAVLNSVTMKIGRAASDAAKAEQCMRSVLEMVRDNTWQGVTSASYLKDTVLGSNVITFPTLQNMTVVLEVSAYPPTAGNSSETISATRNPDGSVTSTSGSGSASLPNESGAKVRVNISWSGTRAHTQEAITVIGRGGILGVNH